MMPEKIPNIDFILCFPIESCFAHFSWKAKNRIENCHLNASQMLLKSIKNGPQARKWTAEPTKWVPEARNWIPEAEKWILEDGKWCLESSIRWSSRKYPATLRPFYRKAPANLSSNILIDKRPEGAVRRKAPARALKRKLLKRSMAKLIKTIRNSQLIPQIVWFV